MHVFIVPSSLVPALASTGSLLSPTIALPAHDTEDNGQSSFPHGMEEEEFMEFHKQMTGSAVLPLC